MFSNARQAIPPVFQEIMKNDAAREALRDGPMTQAGWLALGELVRDRKNLRAGAERALRWNTDKGALA